VTIEVDAADSDGIMQINFLVDGSKVGDDTTAPYSYTVDGLSDGSHTLQAKIKDNTSSYTASEIIIITLVAGPTPTPTPTPPNNPPVAVGDSYSLTKTMNTVSAPGVLANDSDPDGDTITTILVTPPSVGTLTQFNADGSFKYEVSRQQKGSPDSFTYKVSDGQAESAVVTVNINQ
jgi:hypothetical protein